MKRLMIAFMGVMLIADSPRVEPVATSTFPKAFCHTAESLIPYFSHPKVQKRFDDYVASIVGSQFEHGGSVCYKHNLLTIRDQPNQFLNYRRYVERLLMGDSSVVQDIRSLLNYEYKSDGSSCNPSAVSVSWAHDVDAMEHLLDDVSSESDAVMAATELERILSMRYDSGDRDVCAGERIATFHTHDNGTSFSETDLCGSRDSGLLRILISTNRGSYVVYVSQYGISLGAVMFSGLACE